MHWFYSCYVCVMFLSGYIRRFIEHLERKEFERLLLLLLVLFSVLPTFFYFELVPDNGKGLLQMIMVYMLGRYIRMYRDVRLPGQAGVLFVVLWAVNGISHELPIKVGGIWHHLCKDNSITNLTMAVILFYLFKELDIRSVLVNGAAKHIFAVFALNDALVTVGMTLLFDSGFQSKGGIGGFLVLTGIVVSVFVLCLAAGALRNLVLGRADRWLGDQAERSIMAGLVKLGKKYGNRGTEVNE